MTIIAFVTEVGSIQRLLEHLGEPTQPPPTAPARGPPHWEDFDQGSGYDSAMGERVPFSRVRLNRELVKRFTCLPINALARHRGTRANVPVTTLQIST